jgi:SAM-dependent methyltransferase
MNNTKPNRIRRGFTDNLKNLIKRIVTYFVSKYKIQKYSLKLEKIMREDPLYQSMPDDILGKDCLWKLLKEYTFNHVLDVGAGDGFHTKIFYEQHKKVTAISAYDTDNFDKILAQKVEFIDADYLQHVFEQRFDCIWASHTLEHQRNIGLFLDKVYDDLADGGIFAITVPPYEMTAGGGHITCFTVEHLILHLLFAGFDLTDMRVKTYRSNLSVICRKNEKFKQGKNNWATLVMDYHAQLPDYVVESVEKYRKKHPHISPNGVLDGYYERIPFSTKYKWYN